MGLVLAPPVDPEPAVAPQAASPWNLVGQVFFRFAFAYLVLYILPFPVPQLDSLLHPFADPFADDPTESTLSEWIAGPYQKAWDKAVLWTGEHVFDKEITYRPRGSGDTTWNYVQVFLMAMIAGAITLVWTLAALAWARFRKRRRAGYPVLHEWLRVYVRFYL